MAQHIVALDLGKTAARIAVISATFRAATLLGVETVATEPDEPVEQVLKRVREHIGFPIDSLICSLDARRASVRTLHFPFADTKRIAPAVEFELDGQIPYELNQVSVVWQVIERDARTADVLAAVAPRTLLLEQLNHFSNAGLEPRAIVHPAAALAELSPSQVGPADSIATLSMGARQTHLCINRKGLRTARTVHLGGDHVDQSLAMQLGLSADEARAKKETTAMLLKSSDWAAASVQQRKHHEAMALALAPLITHVSATFKGVEREDWPTRLLLTGGLSRLRGLDHYLAERLGIEVAPLDVKAALGALQFAEETEVAPEHAIVLGLALGMFRRGQDMALNFRHGELAYHGDMQLFRGFLTKLALGFACVFWAAFVHAGVRYGLLHSEDSNLHKGFCQATQAIVGKEICEPDRALAALRQSGSDGGTNIPSFSAGALLELLPRSLPAEVDVTFDEVEARVDAVVGQPERMTARGEAASFETTEQVVALLKRDPCVQEAEVSSQRKTQGTGRVEFKLQVKVLCPVGLQPGSLNKATAQKAGK